MREDITIVPEIRARLENIWNTLLVKNIKEIQLFKEARLELAILKEPDLQSSGLTIHPFFG